MRILLLNLFGTIIVLVERPGPLSRRLQALRAWASEENFQKYQ